jgi:hypothetical protein
MKTEEDEEFERIMREQGYRVIGRWREPETEDEKEKRCPTCHRLLKDSREPND